LGVVVYFLTQTIMKKNFIKKNPIVLASIFLMVAAVSCTTENEKLSKEGTTTIQLKLTDAPSLEYDAVYIDIQGVRVGVADEYFYADDPYIDADDEDFEDLDEVEWVDLTLNNPGLYNLPDYRNGEAVLLAGGDIPAGKISQVRLLLGDESHVVIDGVDHPLKTPSAQSSGLKFNLHDVLLPDLMYSFVIDFDASRSVVRTGNDKYILKPVIRTYADAFGGTIKGFALPADSVSYVQIINDEDTLISLPEEDGMFLFAGLDDDEWDLTIFADTTGVYKDSVIYDIDVEDGKVVDLGEVWLQKD
jgi:hypothetical protein